MIKLAVGLLHHPIYDRSRNVVATNITNLDIHDIARVSKVYGLENYFIIHPATEQLMFVERLLDHWRTGDGIKTHSIRSEALGIVRTAESIDQAKRLWLSKDGLGNSDEKVEIIGTTARNIPGVDRVSFKALREEFDANNSDPNGQQKTQKKTQKKTRRVLLLFGTGFGMTDEVLQGCDRILEPLKGAPPVDYRHLSVRSAVSICLDRLMASW